MIWSMEILVPLLDFILINKFLEESIFFCPIHSSSLINSKSAMSIFFTSKELFFLLVSDCF